MATIGKDPGDGRGNELAHDEQWPPSIRPSGWPWSTSLHGPRGEDAGQNRAQRAADAVHAEGVERVVVAETSI